MIGLFIFFRLLFGSGGVNTSITCDMKGEPHDWIEKQQDEHGYLVCSKCRMLPGGRTEEGDGN